MVLAVAQEVAAPAEHALRFEAQLARPVRPDDAGVEIDQLTVVRGVALGGADAVRVVADVAGSALARDVPAVLAEAVVCEDAGAAVALVAEGVSGRTLGGVVRGQVL